MILIALRIKSPEQHGLSLFGHDGGSVFEEKPVARVFAVTSEAVLEKTPQ